MQHLLWQALVRPADPHAAAGKWRPRDPHQAAWRAEWHLLGAAPIQAGEEAPPKTRRPATRRVRLAWPF